jgi:MFS family permease
VVSGSRSADRTALYAAVFLRSVAVGMIGVLAGIYFAQLEFSPATIGIVISAGLAGAACAALAVTWAGDRVGRRRSLIALAALGAAGGFAVGLGSAPIAIGVAAFAGMLNGMGRDRGAALILEQAILPATTRDQERTRAFAWYNVLQDIGHGAGALLAGIPFLLRQTFGIETAFSLKIAVLLYAFLLALSGAFYLALTPAAEAPARSRLNRLSRESRRVLWKISALFGVDAIAGGFLTTALLSLFFYERFGASEAAIGVLFFIARLLNALSHLGAAWLAKRIGLVNTMVFTHIPSSLLLVTVAFAPDFWTAAILFLVREGLVEMDVPTRQSYVMAVVAPEERTLASGVTHLVRMSGWAVAPAFAGVFMQTVGLGLPLLIGAGMKIGYDIMLYFSFRGLRPPEERAS